MKRRRRLIVAATIVVCSVIAGYGIAGAATGPGLTMGQGETDNVSCPNALTVSGQTASALTLNCAADATTTTTVDPTTTEAPTTTVAPTTTTVPPSTTTTVPTGGVWQPAVNTPWMWEIGSVLSTSNANQMGTGVTAWNGDTAPGDNPQMIDIDGIENTAATVTQLHSMGIKAVCYIETGTAGNYYTAAQEGIPTTYYAQLQAAGDFGNKLSGYPEYFVNMNSASTVSIMEAMIDQQCAGKGFDGVETDLDMAWSGADGKTGFTTTEAQGEAYNETLATYMHSLGLAWVAKNLTEPGTAKAVTDVLPYLQGEIDEECNADDAPCSLLNPIVSAGHPVWNAEYTQDGETTAKFCASDNAAGFEGVLYNQNLDGGRNPCR